MADNSLFHQDYEAARCIPAYSLMVLFIEIALVSAVLVAASLHRLRTAKRDAKQILVASACSQAFTFGTALALYISQGLYEAACVCVLGIVVCVMRVGYCLLKLAVRPARTFGGTSAMDASQILMFYKVFSSVSLALCTGTILALIWASRRDDHLFNAVGIAFIYVLCVALIVIVGGIYVYLRRLARHISQTIREAPAVASPGSQSGLEAFQGKIHVLMVNTFIFEVVTLPLLLTVTIVYLVLGYFPVAIVVMALLLNTTSFVTFVVLLLLHSRKYTEATGSRATSKNSSSTAAKDARAVANRASMQSYATVATPGDSAPS